MAENKKKQPGFEASLTRLEEIVRLLENGDATLDTSLSLFEEGVSLVKQCNRQLDEAEAKISVLTKNSEGEITEKNFIPKDSTTDET